VPHVNSLELPMMYGKKDGVTAGCQLDSSPGGALWQAAVPPEAPGPVPLGAGDVPVPPLQAARMTAAIKPMTTATRGRGDLEGRRIGHRVAACIADGRIARPTIPEDA
jgi:hypothetical protein